MRFTSSSIFNLFALILFLSSSLFIDRYECQLIPGVSKARYSNGTIMTNAIYSFDYSVLNNKLYLQGYGGMIYVVNADTMIIENQVFLNTGNFALEGIGLYVDDVLGIFIASYNNIYYNGNTYPMYALSVDMYNFTIYDTLYYGVNRNDCGITINLVTLINILFYDKTNRIFSFGFDHGSTGDILVYYKMDNKIFGFDKCLINGNYFGQKYIYFSISNYYYITLIDIDNGFAVGEHSVNFDMSLYSNNANILPSNANVLSQSIIISSNYLIPISYFYDSLNFLYLYKSVASTRLSGSTIYQLNSTYNNALNLGIKYPNIQIFNQYNLMTLFLDESNNVPSSFFSSSDGKLYKFSYSYNNNLVTIFNLTNYNTNSIYVTTSSSTLDNKYYDIPNKRIYYSSSSSYGGAYSVPIASCNYYYTAIDCINLQDPYCGWCNMQNKCSFKSDCQIPPNSSPNYWSQNINNYTQITSLNPNTLYLQDSNILLNITISNLPFSITNISSWYITLNDNIYNCTDFNSNQRYFSFLINSNSLTNTQNNLIEVFYQNTNILNTTITIIDCNSFNNNNGIGNGCQQCQNNSNVYNKCGWCLIDNQCSTSYSCLLNSGYDIIQYNQCPYYNQDNSSIKYYPINVENQYLNQTVYFINQITYPNSANYYFCEFTFVNTPDIIYSINPISNLIIVNSNQTILVCEIPYGNETSLTYYQNGYFLLNYNIKVTTQYYAIQNNGGNSQLELYNCSLNYDCQNCVNSTITNGINCNWDLYNGICVFGNPYNSNSIVNSNGQCPIFNNNPGIGYYQYYPQSNIPVSTINNLPNNGYICNFISVNNTSPSNFINNYISQLIYVNSSYSYCQTPINYPITQSGVYEFYLTVRLNQQPVIFIGTIGIINCNSYFNDCNSCVNLTNGLCGICSSNGNCVSNNLAVKSQTCPNGSINEICV